MIEITTGEKAPKSGVYKYNGPLKKEISCAPTREELKIPLSKGERAPPVKSCGTSAKWKLDQEA